MQTRSFRFAIQFCGGYCEERRRAEKIKLPRIRFLRVSVYCMRTCRSARDGHFKRVGTNDFDKGHVVQVLQPLTACRHGADGMSNSW